MQTARIYTIINAYCAQRAVRVAAVRPRGGGNMKKVVLLGDSIRLIGYGTKVPELLGKEYDVFQPDDNGRFAKYTLRQIFENMNRIEGCDVVHWNNGLWDVSDLFGDGYFTQPEEYKNTILRIADILLARVKRVIFATTTPVRDTFPYQTNETIAMFNAAVVPALQSRGVIVNDLFAAVYPRRQQLICDDLIHLSDEGLALCSRMVADAIAKNCQ